MHAPGSSLPALPTLVVAPVQALLMDVEDRHERRLALNEEVNNKMQALGTDINISEVGRTLIYTVLDVGLACTCIMYYTYYYYTLFPIQSPAGCTVVCYH